LVAAHFASDSLSPPNGKRVGVRGQYLKIERLLTPALHREWRKENQMKAPIDFAGFLRHDV